MVSIGCLSLSGGQGKTTLSVLLGRYLSRLGKKVLVIDADPQANSTTFLGIEIEDDDPTLLEVLKGDVQANECLYEAEENLYCIPADDGLDQAADYLASSGAAALILQNRLKSIEGFDYVIIDSPPQRSQICSTVIGATSQVLLPVEASVKGYGSLTRTLDAIDELKEFGVSDASILGIVPFRDRWVGARRTKESEMCIKAMIDEVGDDLVLPTIRESERYKQAISQKSTLKELGYADLEYPLEVIGNKLQELN